MKIERHFTDKSKGPYHGVQWELRTSEIRNPDGKVIYHKDKVKVPSSWSAIAADILAQKYFRKTGVPQTIKQVSSTTHEQPAGQAHTVESTTAAGTPVATKTQKTGTPKENPAETGGETTAEEVFHRLAFTWMDWGRRYGYFDSPEDATAFYDEIVYMLAHQHAAPNSPQWFNTGLYAVYGITGPAQGHYYVEPETGELKKSSSAYERPQPHACFILNVEDSLVSTGGIMDLVAQEARIFKFGSGTGSNFSRIRAKNEPLSGGGYSSGLLSFLKINDRSASAIKSGGTTRRAAKMVVLDADHPDIEEYIDWKTEEEYKVAAMVAGSKTIKQCTRTILDACFKSADPYAADAFDPRLNSRLREAIASALEHSVPASYIYRIIQLARQGVKEVPLHEYNTEWDTEAYNTVSGQCSNNSVRLTSDFMKAVEKDKEWELLRRTDGKVHRKIKARTLWDKITFNAWLCADPGLQYHSTINEWHTCLHDGEIRASNPCSEYMFLDDTACNLASLNLMKFYDTETNTFKLEDYKHAIHLWTLVLEISVLMAQFPNQSIAQKSYDYRTLGLGYANLGTLLMVMGIPYDSEEGRNIAAALSAILTGEAYAASAQIAAAIGPFPRYAANREDMLRVIRNHRRAAYSARAKEYEKLSVLPRGLNPAYCPTAFVEAARAAWDNALSLGEKHGYRNAQVTAIAPTGTIGLLMDCDTTGIEPDYALVKYKKLAGGGYFKIINQSIPLALQRLGYQPEEITAIIHYCLGKGTLKKAPGFSYEDLLEKGFTKEILDKLEGVIKNSFSINFVFSPHMVGQDFIERTFHIPAAEQTQAGFNLLKRLGYTDEQIEAANHYACGTMTMEGAPYLQEKDYAVFDTATKCGTIGTRFISWKAHIDMMAAVQPFISGAISKTINMPNSATVDDIKEAYYSAWQSMLKAIAIYRDGSKLSQPLNTLAPGSDAIADTILSFTAKEQKSPAGNGADNSGTVAASKHQPVSTVKKSKRNPLPSRRKGYTQKAKISGHSLFLRTGEYADGTLGEIFLDMHKEGAAFRSLLNSFAIAVSLGLQYGVPLEEFVDAFTFTRFEPNGMVLGHDNIKMATSVIDFIFRDLALNYLHRHDLVQVKPDDLIATSTSQEATEPPNSQAGENHKSDNNGSLQEKVKPVTADNKRELARIQGYEGDPCPSCGHFTLVRNGTCFKCETCGSTTGCS